MQDAASPKEEKAPVDASPMLQGMDRQVIMNAELSLQVKEVDAFLSSISMEARATGGYVQETRQSGTKQQGRIVHISIRVPAAHYGELINRMVGMAQEVLNRREWTNDVTAEYLDLDARVKTKEIHLTQLQKLYDKGGTIKEMMELEQEVARVTADLESLKGRLHYLSNQVALSTIAVDLHEVSSPVSVKSSQTVLERMKRSFIDSWNGTINFTGDLVVLMAAMIPVALYLLLFGTLAYLIFRFLRHRTRRTPSE